MLCWSRYGQSWCVLSFLFRGFATGFETVAAVSSLEDAAAIGKSVKQGSGHFGATEGWCSFAEAMVGGDNSAGSLVKLAEKVEQQSTA